MASILDSYVTLAPSHQNALDIFKDQWTSRLPSPWNLLAAGSTPLFEDPRTTWAIAELGGVQDKTVLELGPLEGGHSYMLEKAGAKSVLAIEANTKAFLRCLIVKEILGLEKVRFLCGDFRPFLASNQERFDVVFASGVLYHMTDPVRLLFDITRVTPQVYLWTHYFEPDLIAKNEVVRDRLGPAQCLEFEGFAYELHNYNYDISLNWSGFCGGSAPYCAWLTRDSILGALRHFGFTNISVAFESPNHPNGPCLSIVAQRGTCR